LNYRHYIPEEASVQNTVHAIWQIDQLTAFQHEYIIPKGIIEVIFNFSETGPILAQVGSTAYHLPNCFISGFTRVPIQVRLPKQQVFFGVLFQPLAVGKIFGCPAAEFSGITVDITLVNSGFAALWHQLAEQDNFDARVSILLDWIRKKDSRFDPREQLINRFLYAADDHDIQAPELASSLCYSSRHLARKIFEATGMNTEEILLYKKYLHAVHLMHHTELPLTAIAYQSRFSDQSHFIKSFKTFTNMTPGAYRQQKSVIKGHLYKDVR